MSADLVSYILRSNDIDTVMHFAASTHVDNSFNSSVRCAAWCTYATAKCAVEVVLDQMVVEQDSLTGPQISKRHGGWKRWLLCQVALGHPFVAELHSHCLSPPLWGPWSGRGHVIAPHFRIPKTAGVM